MNSDVIGLSLFVIAFVKTSQFIISEYRYAQSFKAHHEMIAREEQRQSEHLETLKRLEKHFEDCDHSHG